MKYGVHLALWTDDWSNDMDEHIKLAAHLGFDGIEISLLGMTDHKIKNLRTLIQDQELEVTCTTGLSKEHDLASADSNIRSKSIEYLHWAVETTAGLGSNLLSGVLYSPWGYFAPGQKAERIVRAAEGLSSLHQSLVNHEVVLGLEAINRFETDLINTAAEATNLAHMTGSENIGVLLDAFHMNMEEKDIPTALKTVGSMLVHFHCVENDRGIPGSGHTPWNSIFDGLRSINYNGWLTMEMFIKANVPVSEDLNIWRDIEPNPTDAARRGLAFLRENTSDFG
ncbi:MAG: hypothetical protein CL398_10040 [Acidiferrobacteraceae bacterium]|nr:hypothetical protein [Acidiferrobacteraceae bacterium]|tara:strand:+ start:1222 stop:2067 length:846 start_codon:yes stop_codon:yes gene_type:complete